MRSLVASSDVAAEGSRLLTTGAAAQLAGCHPVTILRAIDAGELTAVWLGSHGHYRVSRQSLERWLRPTDEART